MPASPRDVEQPLQLSERRFEELREPRRELRRRTALIEQLLETLASLERTQYSRTR